MPDKLVERLLVIHNVAAFSTRCCSPPSPGKYLKTSGRRPQAQADHRIAQGIRAARRFRPCFRDVYTPGNGRLSEEPVDEGLHQAYPRAQPKFDKMPLQVPAIR